MNSLSIRNAFWVAPLVAALSIAGCGDAGDLAEELAAGVDQTAEGDATQASDAAALTGLSRGELKQLIGEMQAADGTRDKVNKAAAGTERQKIYFVDPATGQPGKKIQVVRDVKKFSDNTWILDGVYGELYPDGQKYQQGYYRDGRREGEWTFWHENGKVAKVVNYKDGEEDGAVTVFRADGTKELVREYKAGKKHGKWLSFDDAGEKPNGQLEYNEGVPHGSWIDWYESGSKREEKQIKNGRFDGTVTQWHENGEVAHRTDYKAGKRHGFDTIYNASGRKIREIRYKEGKVVPNAGS